MPTGRISDPARARKAFAKITDQLAELQTLTVAQLRIRYEEVFGEPTRSRNKDYLRKKIAYLRLSDTDHPGSGMKPRTLSTGVALLTGGGQQWHPDEGWRRDAPVAGTRLEKSKRRFRTLRSSGSAKRHSSMASLTAR